MIRSWSRLTTSFAIACLATSADAADLTLKAIGGATMLNATTLEVTGTPGDQYLVILSLTGGPTTLPLPHQPSQIDVGLELINLSFLVPGFLGTIPAGGTAAIPLFFPYDPVFAALTLHVQALRIVNNTRFDGKSNPWILTPALPLTSRNTANDMFEARAGYAIIEMPDDTFLIFGGGADGTAASYGQRSVDRYEPATQKFTHVGDMLFPRSSHTATRLGNGKILLAGGADDGVGEPTAFAEIYDPATHTSVAVPNMSTARALHTASLLPNGRVLITGGTTSFNSPQDIVTNGLRTTELYNPATNTWSNGPQLAEPKVGHTATTLLDNRILLAGGFSYVTIIFTIPFVSDKAQVYTPNATTGTMGSNITMTGDRFAHGAIRLDDGKVWIIGGAQDVLSNPFDPVATNSIEEFNPATNSFNLVTTMTAARGAPAVTKLPNGDIVIAGGAYGSLSVPTPDATIDILNPQGQLVGFAQMSHPRANFFAVTLCDSTVLLAGGGEYIDPQNPNDPRSYADAEILHP